MFNNNQDSDSGSTDISRRSWLKKAGTFTSGLAGFSHVGVGATELENTISIRYATTHRGPNNYIHKRVPQAWYDHLQHAREIKEKLGPKLLSKKGIKTVGLSSTDQSYEKYGGRTGFTLHVRLNPNEFTGNLPNSAENITIKTQSVTSPPQYGSYDAACDFTSNNPDYVPAGTVIDTYEGTGSLFCPMKDSDGNPGYMTAAHLWDPCPSGIYGEQTTHADLILGDVGSWLNSEDWAWIKKTDSSEVDYSASIWDETSSTRVPINGWVTPDGIAELNSTNKTVFQRGILTGTVDGIVTEMNMSQSWKDCIDWDGEGVQVEGDQIFGDGDSGGPVYEPRVFDGKEYAYLVNLGSQKVNYYNFVEDCSRYLSNSEVWNGTRGTAMYRINDYFDIYYN